MSDSFNLGSAVVSFGRSYVFVAVLAAALGPWAREAQSAAPDEYIISIGDELEFDILEDDVEPQKFSVGSNGQLQLPLIGGVPVEGTTVTQAREAIRATYVSREIFVSPTIELSIASFRPVFVLGDVKTPGNYPFQMFMTAEQAAGLAGGILGPGGNEESRILERRAVEASLTGINAELARLATQLARIEAQLAEKEEIDWYSLPDEIRADLDQGQFDSLAGAQNQIIALDRDDRKTRESLMKNTIAEAETRLSLLAQRVEVIEGLIQRSREDIERTRAAVKRGVKSQSALAEEEQALSRLDVELLRLREERSAALVQIGTLQNEVTRLTTDRTRNLYAERQTVTAEVTRQRALRGAARDRLSLLNQWISNASGKKAEVLVDYQVKRRGTEGTSERLIASDDELMPGDLLTVKVKALDLPSAERPL